MKHIIISIALFSASTTCCYARSSGDEGNAPNSLIVKFDRYPLLHEQSASSTDRVTLLDRQYPADLIPAAQHDEATGSPAGLASMPSVELALGGEPGGANAASPEEPPIVVTGPKLPKPVMEPASPEVRLIKVRQEISRMELGYHILSAIDAVATISCVSRNACREMNPLMGSHPSVLRVLGVKALTGFLFHRTIKGMARKDPYRARSVMRVSLGVQGAVTGLTMTSLF